MGARLRVFLTPEEDETLRELRSAPQVPQRVKDRAEVIRLNHRGWYVEAIAEHFNWHVNTVRTALNRWDKWGLGGLWEQKGRGRKPTWSEADLVYVETCLREDPRSYSSQQLAQQLATERGVRLSGDQLRQILKKRG